MLMIPNADRSARFACRSAAVCAWTVILVGSSARAIERMEIELRETGGLARRGYPAHALLKLPQPRATTTRFRLLDQGMPVVAQFRPDRNEPTANWWLDFQAEMRPHEMKKLAIEYGDDVAGGPERPTGHKLTADTSHFAIANAPYITWTVPRDLRGLLRSVDFPPAEFLRTDSPGLVWRDRQARQHAFSGTARIVRQGAMAVGLRFESIKSHEELRDGHSTVDLTFPAPVSWMEVDWNVEDPRDEVAALGMQLNLNLEPASAAAPTLVDFGATSAVYAALRPGQSVELSADSFAKPSSSSGRAWEIVHGDAERLMPFAVGPPRMNAQRVEGWAHVMDRKTCLALAVDRFARESNDRMRVDADGQVTVWRAFAPELARRDKSLRLWLHFVFFPPQASAAASPQQMQSPLEVRLVAP